MKVIITDAEYQSYTQLESLIANKETMTLNGVVCIYGECTPAGKQSMVCIWRDC